MANRQGDVDMPFAHVSTPKLTVLPYLAWLLTRQHAQIQSYFVIFDNVCTRAALGRVLTNYVALLWGIVGQPCGSALIRSHVRS